MNYFKRAYCTAVRNISKTILMFLTILTISLFFMISAVMSNAVIQTELNLNEKLPAIAVLEWEYRAMGNLNEDGVRRFYFPTTDMISRVEELSYVRYADFRSQISLISDRLEFADIPIERLEPGNYLNDIKWFAPQSLRNIDFGVYIEMFPVSGINIPIMTDLELGLISLMEGRIMTYEEIYGGVPVAIVSRDFAEINNLEIGDKFVLEHIVPNHKAIYNDPQIEQKLWNPVSYWHLSEFNLFEQKIELELIGIFNIDAPFVFRDDLERSQLMIREVGKLFNTIYVPHRLLERVLLESLPYQQKEEHLYLPGHFFQIEEDFITDSPIGISGFFLLDNSRYFNDFRNAAHEILPEGWSVYNLSPTFAAMSTSLDVIQNVANFIFFGALAASFIIISLIVFLFLSDRKREIGIYLSLGEKKSRIGKQLLIEVLIIFLFAVTGGFIIGNHISDYVSRGLIEQELLNLTDEIAFSDVAMELPRELQIFNTGPMDIEELWDSFDTSLSMHAVLSYLFATIMSVIFSSVMSVFLILRKSPKDILL